MKSLRATTIAAALLVAMTGIAGAAVKQPSLMSQSAAQPKAMDAGSGAAGGGTHTALMAKKHNFLASSKVGSRKDKAHGWVAPAKPTSKANAMKHS